jgi:hypothetical protein
MVGVSKTGIAGLSILFIALFALVFPSTKQASGLVLPMLNYWLRFRAVSIETRPALTRWGVAALVGIAAGFTTLVANAAGALLAPAVLLGAFLGRRIMLRINQKPFEELALALSAIAGVILML